MVEVMSILEIGGDNPKINKLLGWLYGCQGIIGILATAAKIYEPVVFPIF